MGYHSEPWFNKKITDLVQLFKLNNNIWITHFPSSGLSAVISWAEHNQQLEYRIIRYALHDIFKAENSPEKHFVNELFENLISTSKPIRIIIDIPASNLTNNLTQIKNLIKHMRNVLHTNISRVNVILVSTIPPGDMEFVNSLNIIQTYFNHSIEEYDASLVEDYKNFGFGDLQPDLKIKLKKLSGDLIFIHRSIFRDLLINNNEEQMQTLNIDAIDFRQSPVLNFRLEKCLRQFPAPIRSAMSGYAIGLDKAYPDFLSKVGILDSRGLFKSAVLKKYLCMTQPNDSNYSNTQHREPYSNSSVKLIKINDKISLNPLSCELYFNMYNSGIYLTDQEFILLNKLIISKGKIVSRTEIAEILWEFPAEQFSDWAIDKLVSRLREKLNDKKPHKIIITLKKRGFILN